MKYLFIISLILTGFSLFSQSRYPIRADTVVIEKIGGTAELLLKNSTKDSSGGVLTNTGAGKTSFIKKKTDAYRNITADTETIVDTSFTDLCGYHIADYNLLSFPEFIGQERVRVWASGMRQTEDCFWGVFYRWYPATGILRMFPAIHTVAGQTAMPVLVEAY